MGVGCDAYERAFNGEIESLPLTDIDKLYASFEYDANFLKSKIEISPIMMLERY